MQQIWFSVTAIFYFVHNLMLFKSVHYNLFKIFASIIITTFTSLINASLQKPIGSIFNMYLASVTF